MLGVLLFFFIGDGRGSSLDYYNYKVLWTFCPVMCTCNIDYRGYWHQYVEQFNFNGSKY